MTWVDFERLKVNQDKLKEIENKLKEITKDLEGKHSIEEIIKEIEVGIKTLYIDGEIKHHGYYSNWNYVFFRETIFHNTFTCYPIVSHSPFWTDRVIDRVYRGEKGYENYSLDIIFIRAENRDKEKDLPVAFKFMGFRGLQVMFSETKVILWEKSDIPVKFYVKPISDFFGKTSSSFVIKTILLGTYPEADKIFILVKSKVTGTGQFEPEELERVVEISFNDITEEDKNGRYTDK